MERDYKLNPLKRGEYISENDLRELYLERNLSIKQIVELTGIKRDNILKPIKKYGLVKTPEMIQELKKRNCMEKYGVDSPNKLKEVQEKKKQVYLEKYGVDNPSKSPEIINKIKQSFIDKYGVDNPQKNVKVRRKTKRTCLKKYGGVAPACDINIANKMKQTRIEHYGPPKVREPRIEGMTPSGLIVTPDVLMDLYIRQNKTAKYIAELFNVDQSTVFNWLKKYNIQKPKGLKNENISESNSSYYSDEQNKLVSAEKRKQTCQKKYGVDNPAQSEEIKERGKQTNLKKYGVDNASKSSEIIEKIKQNNLEKYGVEWVRQLPEIVDKGKQTLIDKYGVDNPNKIPEIQEKIKETCLQKYGVDNPFRANSVKEQIKQTFKFKYGEHPMKLKCTQLKVHNTKKNNNSYSKSIGEEKIFNLLSLKYKVVLRQYYSKDYPFACDFYIPERDLYIEFQGIWTHGGKPFDENDMEDQKMLIEWEEKAKTSDFYANAIEVWTICDPLKRKIAKENNLNYLEFFTFKEFEDWYNTLEEKDG